MKRLKGSITVFLLILLGSAILLATSLIDVLRFNRAVSENASRLSAALGSVATTSDNVSLDRYGMTFGNKNGSRIAKEVLENYSDYSCGNGMTVKNTLQSVETLGGYCYTADNEKIFDCYSFATDMIRAFHNFGDALYTNVVLDSFRRLGSISGIVESNSDMILEIAGYLRYDFPAYARMLAQKYRADNCGSFGHFSERISALRAGNWDKSNWELFTDSGIRIPDSAYEAVQNSIYLLDEGNFFSNEYLFTYSARIISDIAQMTAMIEQRGTNYLDPGEPLVRSGPVYCMEYLITGTDSDVKNLELVIERIYRYRLLADITSICRSRELREKLSAREEMGFQQAAAIMADMEARADVELMLKGVKVPLLKNREQFLCTPDTTEGELAAICGSFAGYDLNANCVGYMDYLRYLMFHTTSLETITARCADVICLREDGYAELEKTSCCKVVSTTEIEPYSLPGLFLKDISSVNNFIINY